MTYSDFEKSILNKIVNQNTSEMHNFGFTAKDILFPSGDSAVFIYNDLLRNGSYYTPLFLLSLHDGGRNHANVRKRMVEFVSLLQYLDENRLIYTMDSSEYGRPYLYYQDYPHIHITPLQINTERISDHLSRTEYQAEIDNHTYLNFKVITNDGYQTRVENAALTLGDCNHIGETGFGRNLKNDLIKYLNSYIYPSVTLNKLVLNDYKTDAEIVAEKSLNTAEKQVKRANATLIISIIAVICSIILPILSEISSDPYSFIVKLIGLILCGMLVAVLGYEIAICNFEK